MRIPEPSPAHVYVAVFERDGALPVCLKEAAGPDPVPAIIELAPRERRRLVVPLQACRLPPGEYRYEAWYQDRAGGGARSLACVGPEHGRIVVQRSDEGTASGSASEATRDGRPSQSHAAPSPPAPHLRPVVPPLGPESIACARRELVRRGIEVPDDAPLVPHSDGPPTLDWENERRRMILQMYPDVAALCGISP